MMHENLLNTQSVYLKHNPNKVRWLTESKITPTDLFCIGSGENSVIYFFAQNPCNK